MTQPHEAHGLTAALAKSIDQRAADLTALNTSPSIFNRFLEAKCVPMQEKKRQRDPIQPTRYAICVQLPGVNKSEQIGIGRDKDAAIKFAREHHKTYGYRTWIWNVKTGERVLLLERRAVKAATA